MPTGNNLPSSMRIYFSSSMSESHDQARLSPAIIEHLRQFGEVCTEFVTDPRDTSMGEHDLPTEAIYHRTTDYISQCDVLVVEVTIPSTRLGMKVAHAGIQGKPVLALFQPTEGHRLGAMIAGDPNVMVIEYESPDDMERPLGDFFRDFRESERYSFNKVSFELFQTYDHVLQGAEQKLYNRNDVSPAVKILATFCAENFQLLRSIKLLVDQQELFAPILLTRPIVENWLTWGYIKGERETRSQQFIANSVKRQIEFSETFLKQKRLSTDRKSRLRVKIKERKIKVAAIEKRFGCWPGSLRTIAQEADSSNKTDIYTKRWESFFKFLSSYQHPSGTKSADFINQKDDQIILTSFRDDRSLPVFDIGLSYSNPLMLDINAMLHLSSRHSLEQFGTEVIDIPILD